MELKMVAVWAHRLLVDIRTDSVCLWKRKLKKKGKRLRMSTCLPSMPATFSFLLRIQYVHDDHRILAKFRKRKEFNVRAINGCASDIHVVVVMFVKGSHRGSRS